MGNTKIHPGGRYNLPPVWGDLALDGTSWTANEVLRKSLKPPAVKFVLRHFPRELVGIRNVGVGDVDYQASDALDYIKDHGSMGPLPALRIPGNHHRGTSISPPLDLSKSGWNHQCSPTPIMLSTSKGIFPRCTLHGSGPHHLVHQLGTAFFGCNPTCLQRHGEGRSHTVVLGRLPDGEYRGSGLLAHDGTVSHKYLFLVDFTVPGPQLRNMKVTRMYSNGNTGW